MTTQNQHHHTYKEIGYIREVGTTSPSNLLIHDVSPRMINRIILTRNCEKDAMETMLAMKNLEQKDKGKTSDTERGRQYGI